jgi:hypothetical protein
MGQQFYSLFASRIKSYFESSTYNLIFYHDQTIVFMVLGLVSISQDKGIKRMNIEHNVTAPIDVLHIIFVIPMIINDVNLYVAFRGVSGLSS